jgi:hypothetical protein
MGQPTIIVDLTCCNLYRVISSLSVMKYQHAEGKPMRKRIINQNPQDASPVDQSWLDLQRLAQVEVTSEDTVHPIEAALIPGFGQGWRASQTGRQTIRILFDDFQRIRRIQLQFYEDQQARTQEFVLSWSSDPEKSYREIVRQQYNFSPPGTISEFEDYTVDLVGVKLLELSIVPDISGGDAVASVAQFRIA